MAGRDLDFFKMRDLLSITTYLLFTRYTATYSFSASLKGVGGALAEHEEAFTPIIYSGVTTTAVELIITCQVHPLTLIR